MNKAINREELLTVLYKGRATPMYVHGFYPDLPGWDPTWEKRFPEMYGYDLTFRVNETRNLTIE
jgi:ABC-type transport system substrate-binding protein